MEHVIKTQEELRVAVTKINANVIGMCNTGKIDDIIALFTESKDLLIAIYKHNVDRLSTKNNK